MVASAIPFLPLCRWLIGMLMLLLAGSPLYAASISVQTDRNPVSLQESFQLTFTVTGKQDGEPDFSPLNADFELLGTSTSSQYSMINGNVSQSRQYTLTLVAKRTGDLTIPSVAFGRDHSPASRIRVTHNSGGNNAGNGPGAATDDPDFFLEASIDETSPYVQQQTLLTLKIYRRIQWAGASLSDPAFEGGEAVVKQLGEQKTYRQQRDGKEYMVTEIRYALYPQQSGKLTIAPFLLTAQVPAESRRRSSSPFDSFFRQPRLTNRIARSQPLELTVKPIPVSFRGEHWLPARSLTLNEVWSTEEDELTNGEPLTRTIGIIADGLLGNQLPESLMREQSGLKVYPDKAQLQEQAGDQGIVSSSSQKYALIPTRNGHLPLPAIRLHWWNTDTDREEIAILPERRFRVTGAATDIAPDTGRSESGIPEDTEPVRPVPTTTDDTDAPAWTNWLLASNALLLLLWLVTLAAWRKARRHTAPDPETGNEQKRRPSSQQRLRELQRACQSGNPAAIRVALLDWAATQWNPAPTSLGALAKRVPEEMAVQIERLNQHLYGTAAPQWDAQRIAEMASTLSRRKSTREAPVRQILEPMYR